MSTWPWTSPITRGSSAASTRPGGERFSSSATANPTRGARGRAARPGGPGREESRRLLHLRAHDPHGGFDPGDAAHGSARGALTKPVGHLDARLLIAGTPAGTRDIGARTARASRRT